jgi:hypothetical protein
MLIFLGIVYESLLVLSTGLLNKLMMQQAKSATEAEVSRRRSWRSLKFQSAGQEKNFMKYEK